MMKKNIFFLLLILSLPFALSSQTRKAIPAGRYEALSGIKISRSGKADMQQTNLDSSKQVWVEIEKYFGPENGEILYANLASTEVAIKAKNFHEAKNMDQGFDLLITSDLTRDQSVMKFLRGKKMIALFDQRPIDKIITSLKKFEVITFRADTTTNFYLLKTK